MSDYEYDVEDEEEYDEGYDSIMDDDDDMISQSKSYLDKGKRRADERKVSYESLSQEELLGRIDREIGDVSSILDIDRALSLALMSHNCWKKDQLIENYMDSPSKVLKAVGGSKANSRHSDSIHDKHPHKRQKVDRDEKLYDCIICCEQYDEEHMPHLSCQHRFCDGCWKEYIVGLIKGEGQCLITCMDDGCPLPVSELFIKSLVDEECFERYGTLKVQSFVTALPDWSFCPHPSCTRIVHCLSFRKENLTTMVPSVECGAGHTFCFGCRMDQSHSPTICMIAEKWKASKDDSGTNQWITANTRTCPKCSNNIEKGGGCNRMVCRHCKYQFCWMCMKNWDVHGYNKSVCNAFVEPPKTDNMNVAAVKLERWLFYFDRFNNHEISSALDEEFCKLIAYKIKEIQDTSGLSWIEATFMQTAFDELTKCRMTLKWTYAMAHFLAAGNKKHLFEDIQADLEKAVEQLSELLNEPIVYSKIPELRQKVIDKTVYVQKRHEILLDDVATGLLEGEWEWTIPME